MDCASLTNFFIKPQIIIGTAHITGLAVRVYQIAVFMLLCIAFFGIWKKQSWSRGLTLAWYFFCLVFSFVRLVAPTFRRSSASGGPLRLFSTTPYCLSASVSCIKLHFFDFSPKILYYTNVFYINVLSEKKHKL